MMVHIHVQCQSELARRVTVMEWFKVYFQSTLSFSFKFQNSSHHHSTQHCHSGVRILLLLHKSNIMSNKSNKSTFRIISLTRESPFQRVCLSHMSERYSFYMPSVLNVSCLQQYFEQETTMYIHLSSNSPVSGIASGKTTNCKNAILKCHDLDPMVCNLPHSIKYPKIFQHRCSITRHIFLWLGINAILRDWTVCVLLHYISLLEQLQHVIHYPQNNPYHLPQQHSTPSLGHLLKDALGSAMEFYTWLAPTMSLHFPSYALFACVDQRAEHTSMQKSSHTMQLSNQLYTLLLLCYNVVALTKSSASVATHYRVVSICIAREDHAGESKSKGVLFDIGIVCDLSYLDRAVKL